MKVCPKCKVKKSLEEFAKAKNRKDGRGSYCKPCLAEFGRERYQRDAEASLGRTKRYYRENKDQFRNHYLNRKYGISLDDYRKLSEQQGHVCAICKHPEVGYNGKDPKVLAVDHCHVTGKIRGLLCFKCNQTLGRMGDSLENAMKFFTYLESAERSGDAA